MVKVRLQLDAERDLKKLDRSLRRELLRECQDIATSFLFDKPLQGSLFGYRARRIGLYRIIYSILEHDVIEIIAIGHRKDVYNI